MRLSGQAKTKSKIKKGRHEDVPVDAEQEVLVREDTTDVQGTVRGHSFTVSTGENVPTVETSFEEELAKDVLPVVQEEEPTLDVEEHPQQEEETFTEEPPLAGKKRRGKKVEVVDDEDLEEEDSEESAPKSTMSFKDVLLSFVETTVAAAVLTVVGYQLGNIYLGNLLQGILGG